MSTLALLVATFVLARIRSRCAGLSLSVKRLRRDESPVHQLFVQWRALLMFLFSLSGLAKQPTLATLSASSS
ncbi:uncharacterized protein SCHCODRAFT_02233031 [Schizophyllum commune H4-8]|uniref:uncharacterized protein n=1 Tax=Schizophyllum commune (strain H4-8 / FGSC 9210) TaxID=578458 RepID=UPI00215E8515|nr:uncharacterized protein SCHCODRAFT_02233031 [Schizophyllum commune H4-8]KAI5895503.1 hypothetical protein SCHCODRAFT_02233031 [Schizophyllum commune H4-8]